MTMHSLLLLPFSADEGWPSLAARRPSYWNVFLLLVVPLSVLAAVMVYFGGSTHPEMLPHTAGGRDWVAVAYVFLIMEFLSVGVMGLVIKNLAEAYEFRIDYPGAYLLASIFPVPMWLSSLGLLASNLIVTGIIALAGLALSCGLVYHGLEGLSRSREGASATVMTLVILVIGFGLWLSMLTVAFG